MLHTDMFTSRFKFSTRNIFITVVLHSDCGGFLHNVVLNHAKYHVFSSCQVT